MEPVKSDKAPIQTHQVSPEQRKAELKNKCATCTHSRQWTQSVSKSVTMRHPLFACVNEQSPRHGVWLAGFATCDLHSLDEDKLTCLLERATTKAPPRIVVPGGAMDRAPKRSRSKVN